jgi:hypothetical protein
MGPMIKACDQDQLFLMDSSEWVSLLPEDGKSFRNSAFLEKLINNYKLICRPISFKSF